MVTAVDMPIFRENRQAGYNRGSTIRPIKSRRDYFFTAACNGAWRFFMIKGSKIACDVALKLYGGTVTSTTAH